MSIEKAISNAYWFKCPYCGQSYRVQNKTVEDYITRKCREDILKRQNEKNRHGKE